MIDTLEHEPLPVYASELVLMLIMVVIVVVIVGSVAVVSYRRSRCLSRFSVPKSLAIALISGVFWVIWVIASVVNHQRLQMQWQQYWDDRRSESDRPAEQLVS